MKLKFHTILSAIIAACLLSCAPVYRHPGIPTGLPERLAENYPDKSPLLCMPLYCDFPFFFTGNTGDIRFQLQDPFLLEYPYSQAAKKISGGLGIAVAPWRVTAGYHKELLGVFLIGGNGKIIFAVPQKVVRRDDYAYAWRFQYAFMSKEWQQEIASVLSRNEYALPRENGRFFVPPEMLQGSPLDHFKFEVLYSDDEKKQIIDFTNKVKPATTEPEQTGVWTLPQSFK